MKLGKITGIILIICGWLFADPIDKALKYIGIIYEPIVLYKIDIIPNVYSIPVLSLGLNLLLIVVGLVIMIIS